MHQVSTNCGCAATARRARTPLLNLLVLAFTAAQQRRKLKDLPPHLRDDLGLSDDDIRRESKRRFWDVPKHWQQ